MWRLELENMVAFTDFTFDDTLIIRHLSREDLSRFDLWERFVDILSVNFDFDFIVSHRFWFHDAVKVHGFEYFTHEMTDEVFETPDFRVTFIGNVRIDEEMDRYIPKSKTVYVRVDDWILVEEISTEDNWTWTYIRGSKSIEINGPVYKTDNTKVRFVGYRRGTPIFHGSQLMNETDLSRYMKS